MKKAQWCVSSRERNREMIAVFVPGSRCRSYDQMPNWRETCRFPNGNLSLACHLAPRPDDESDQRRPASHPIELALRDAAVRSGTQNISRGLGGNGRGAHSFAFILRAATMDFCRDHRSKNAGKTFPFDMESAPDPRLLTFRGLYGENQNNERGYRPSRRQNGGGAWGNG